MSYHSPETCDQHHPTRADKPPNFLTDNRQLIAEWVYRGYECRIWHDYKERTYPLDDNERYVAKADDATVYMTSTQPYQHHVAEIITRLEHWADQRMTSWL